MNTFKESFMGKYLVLGDVCAIRVINSNPPGILREAGEPPEKRMFNPGMRQRCADV